MANEAVLKYLRNTNRPYSANDIVMNLHKEFGKTVVQRALDALVQQTVILEKVYGKQKVYVFRQKVDGDVKEDEVQDFGDTIAELTEELSKTEEKLKAIEGNLKGLQSSLTTSEALLQVMVKEQEVEGFSNKLQVLEKHSTPISPQRLEAVKTGREKALKEYRYRKRLCMDAINAILEGYPKPKKVFFEDVGIETDEDVNFTLGK